MSLPYEQHLYAIMWPNHALVASNLGPDEFGKHYTIGSSRYFHGQVVFAEIWPSLIPRPKKDSIPDREQVKVYLQWNPIFPSCYLPGII